jgi:hypothetical protein
MNGWLLVRVGGIVVGIATLLRVATNEGMVTYDPLFQAWMDQLRGLLELELVMDYVMQPILYWLLAEIRSLGIAVPDLQDDWRPALVLSTLMFGSISRNRPSKWPALVAPIGAVIVAVWSGLLGALSPVTGAICALVLGCVLAAASRHQTGLVQKVITRIVTIATLVIIVLGITALVDVKDSVHLAAWFAAIFAGVVGAFARPGKYVSSVCVVVLACAIGVVLDATVIEAALAGISTAGCVLLVTGAVASWNGGWHEIATNTMTNAGIDILGVMLGALFLASLFANPPIW